MKRGFVLVLIAVLARPGALEAAGFERQTLRVPGHLLRVIDGDLDGDGLTDLAVAYRRGAGPAAKRFIGVFFRGERAFPERPDLAFAVPPDAVCFDAGDAIGGSDDELVYLTSSGVLAQSFRGRKPARPARIVTRATIAVAPEEEDFVAWDFLVSSTSTLATLIVPTRREILLYRREGEVWREHARADVTGLAYYDAGEPFYRPSERGPSTGSPYAFRVTTVVPNLALIDQSGDGRPDLVAHFEDRVLVHVAGPDGRIPQKPTHSSWFRVRTEEELESRSTTVYADVIDLDGDGIADIAVTKVSGGITRLTTELRLYRGSKGGGFGEPPAQVLADEGFAALTQYVDLDGDGALELVRPHAAISILVMSRAMLASELEFDLRIHRRTSGGLFDPRPVQTLESTFGLDFSVGATIRGTAPMLGHDFDGDGRPDAILSQGEGKMELHRGLGRGERILEEEGRVTLSAPGSRTTQAVFRSPRARSRPDLVVYDAARRDQGDKLFVFLNRY